MSGRGILGSLGLTSTDLTEQGLSKLILASKDPLAEDADDYPSLAEEAKDLEPTLDALYMQAVKTAELEDQEVAEYYNERSKDYLELHQQIDSSASLLLSLSAFLSTFQTDLSSVSTSIASLQGRSKLIESRLGSRKHTEAVLSPYLSSIIVPPGVARLLLHSTPSDEWLTAIRTFEEKLTALRSLPRNAQRTSLEVAAETLRLTAAYKIRDFLVSILQPFRTSITPNLQITQRSVLRRYRDLFAFLQRHAARVAHEVQRAYVGTARWYFETGFRRYVRALEKVRARGPAPVAKRREDSDHRDDAADFALNARVEGGSVLLAYMADEPSLRHAPEYLFRSLSIVFADNALSEYLFVSSFFGVPLSEGVDMPGKASNGAVSSSESRLETRRPSAPSSVDGAESVASSPADVAGADRRRKTAVDVVWKGVVEPMMEYHTTFTSAILTSGPANTISLYTMIRLTDSLLAKASSCPPLESHLMSVKMQLWPPFQASFKSTISHLTKMASESASAQTSGFFGSSRPSVKEGAIFDASRTYTRLFNAMIAVAPPEIADEDPDSTPSFSASLATNESAKVFGDLRNVRETLISLIKTQAARSGSTDAIKAFLIKVYQGVLHDLMVAGRASVPRCQAEIAYWRELLRKIV